MAEEARGKVRGWSRGPRSLLLRRHDHHGFGFTLRHFIVYPPESYTVLAGDRRLGLRAGALDEPMDTIFVKQVKPGSAADRAGLCTGDRVVSVNGETISGHSYASVVHRIHNSGPSLHLLVVPQDHDILQLYFNETAHRPESNLMVRHDSACSNEGGQAASQTGSDDSNIMSRIRRSCEQKEEFLRRPAAPPSTAIKVKEFYGRPQKLQPPPHWPPAIPASPASPPLPEHTGFVRPRMGVAAPLCRIQEAPSQPPPHSTMMVSARARQFESGAPAPDRTSLYRSELARLSHKRMVPDVSGRARQYESQAEYHSRDTRSLDSTGSLSPVSHGGLSGNRLVPVGGRNLHCEPPHPHHDEDDLRPRSNSAESLWPSRNRAMRQDSYLAACHKPPAQGPRPAEESAHPPPPFPSPPLPEIRVEPAPRPVRPATLDLRLYEDLGPADTSASASGTEDSNSSPLGGSPAVVPWRDKSPHDTGSEEERATRRVSYLRATWPDRMAVDSDADADADHSCHRLHEEAVCAGQQHADKENQQAATEGPLHCKLTLVDGKRAGDRSWKQVWAVLRGPVLSLYKERRDSLPLTETVPVAVEGSDVDLRCAVVSAAEDYTKRRHVLRLQTPTGSQLLLQAADQADMARWMERLGQQAGGHAPRSPNAHNAPVVVEPAPASSPKTKTWKGRVAKQFRRIQHGGSPVSPTAPPPPGTTIGVPLEDCPPAAVNKYVPRLVEMCTAIVEQRGLEIIGIYRVPGNTAAVSSLTEEVNRGVDEALRDRDVNVISSLLKSFFRRLPDALLTSELYPSFIAADKIADPRLRMHTIRKLVHELPEHHYETLRFLLLHLKRVVEHSAMNKMEARNLAIVFGPTLVRTADDNMVTMVTDMSHQCRIVETLILHVDWCFGDEAVDRLPLEVSGGGEPAVANHDLLLSNIHKVEGMTKELSARDIVSSIICAANRKMTKTKGRKPHGSSGSGGGVAEDHTDSVQMKVQHRKERLASRSETSDPDPASRPDNEAEAREVGVNETSDQHHLTYAALSDTTRERIRRFEQETKAMLQRARRPEPELNKRELETDDHHLTSERATLVKMAAEVRGPPPAEIRRGTSAENLNTPPPPPENLNLKRFKSGKETLQNGPEASLARCGSLDSVHDLTPSHGSDEGGDLLVSLTSTFDAKLRSLLGTDSTDAAPRQPATDLYTDPSLHRRPDDDKQEKEEDSKDERCVEKDKCESSNLLTQLGETRAVRLYRSESMNHDERNTKLKRSDSLTKTEKTESNLNKRRQLEAGRWNVVKLKRKTGSAVDRSIKRRHTVGGTKDFDKVNWLDNRQREAAEQSPKERRTSSPDLSSRPHSLAEPPVPPLESHV